MAARKKVAKAATKRAAAPAKKPSRAKPRSEAICIVGRDGAARRQLATAMARELERKLVRVDLGRVINRYIGETEKALNAVFAGAEGQDVVLFLDEADALFGPRGDGAGARRHFAGLDIAHLFGFAKLTAPVEAFADTVLRAKPRPKKDEA